MQEVMVGVELAVHLLECDSIFFHAVYWRAALHHVLDIPMQSPKMNVVQIPPQPRFDLTISRHLSTVALGRC